MEFEELPFKVKEFIFQKIIGQGSFGKIYLAQDSNTFAFYAIKSVPKSMFKNSHIKKLFKDEVSITGTIKHENVIHLYKMLESDDTFFLVFDYCEMGRKWGLFDFFFTFRNSCIAFLFKIFLTTCFSYIIKIISL